MSRTATPLPGRSLAVTPNLRSRCGCSNRDHAVTYDKAAWPCVPVRGNR
ncbi:hypothetical protein [Euzebya pacifica]|nr:hypothetical protein [Euzebya pacifica]